MKFMPGKRSECFNTAANSVVASTLSLAGVGLAVYVSLQDRSALPLAVAFGVLSALEALALGLAQRTASIQR